MNTYIAILRGINVLGHAVIRMQDLKNRLDELGFQNVTTYIQSGNIIFEFGMTDQNELAGMIHNHIRLNFDLNVQVLVKNVYEMSVALENNPFVNTRNENIDKLHVTFFNKVPDPEWVHRIMQLEYLPDEFAIVKNLAYVFCPNGYGRTKFNNQFFESKLKVSATTRNWKTVNKLVVLSQNRI
jgi:uncharacterized protein (DUF1697 family)